MSVIKAGDTVRLKSGGPLMTVESVTNNAMTKSDPPILKAMCSWFNGTTRLQEKFAVESLNIENNRQ